MIGGVNANVLVDTAQSAATILNDNVDTDAIELNTSMKEVEIQIAKKSKGKK